MKILVTGCAGFIGFSISELLLKKKFKIYGIDNLNSSYDKKLKLARLKELKKYKNFYFNKLDISNYNVLKNNFYKNKYTHIIHLAALAGVRNSIEYPEKYLKNNISAFYNIIDLSKSINVDHFIYASSSSVYGDKKNFPLVESFDTDKPQSFYAATKKSNEILSYTYSSIYKLKCTGLRFFTVYGPWGRPDMALFKFVHKIINKQKIELYNYGNHYRDFTYIDDVIYSIFKLLKKPPITKKIPYNIFNVCSQKTVSLKTYIKLIEKSLNMKSTKIMRKLQKGDVIKTNGSVKSLFNYIKYKPTTDIEKGINKFVIWYKKFYRIV